MSIEAHGPTLPAAPADASPFWTLSRVADALSARARGPLPRGDHRLARVWTDTRSLRSGDLFVALSGEKFDAHDFLAAAVQSGATGVVVSRLSGTAGLGVPVFVVDDTRAALGALGRYRRRAWNGPVIGVVGTNGKTSTKELIRAALDSRLEVHATTGNLNNLVGVPLTLLAIPDDADVAVVEMGTNHPGEVATLRDIVEPTIVVVTSIAEEHLEGLGDLEGVLREELSGCDGVGIAVVPASQADVVTEARRRARRVVAAGLDGGDVPVAHWSLALDGRGTLVVNGVQVDVPLRGAHNLRNATLALAVAHELGISAEDAARGIGRMTLPPMRSNIEQLGRVTLINDAYNSNPGSARAAIELLAHAGGAEPRQRVAVLGTMLELGPTAPRLHDEIARAALDADVAVIAGVGEFAAALERVNAPKERILTAIDADDLWPALASRLQPDAIILLKGSRGVRLERLVPHITAWAQRSA
ncbi:MAG TPA: UDP-N-acetylmuramoyl-tripeptide--D-alanyl-D-alanine ligase [Gemmatimonadaceae bacterium]|nr:UDP-N-acetylmuramoyl-tripeptide--D-alanyl-D-alanine ligase [Gemmatimonadaceae bacterium]